MTASFLVTNYAGATTTGSDIIGMVEARLTAAGWTFVEEYPFTQNVGSTATTTNGSFALASVTTPANLLNGYSVGGAGIQAGTTVVSGGGTATPTLSQAATASASGVTLTASRAMRVWKNSGTQNAAGADFYVGFVKDTTGGPRFAVRAFENWDVTNKVIGNPVIQGGGSVAANSSFYSATVATNGVGTGAAYWNPAGGTTPAMVDALSPTALLNNTNYDVGVLASKSYLVLTIGFNGTNGSNIAAWVIGLYNPLWTDSQLMYPPLSITDLTNVSVSGGTTNGVSRSLRGTAANPGNFGCIASPESLLIGSVSSGGLTKERQSQSVRASRVALASYYVPFTTGTYRGTLYDAMAVASDGSLKIGDTVNVGSTTWTVMAPYVSNPAYMPVTGSNSCYLFNVTAGS